MDKKVPLQTYEDVLLRHLKKMMNNFTLTNYGIPLNIPVVWSNRMRSNLGKFEYKRNRRTHEVIPNSMKIVFNSRLQKTKDRKLVEDIAKHEAIHFALCVLGKPNSDGSQCFEKELRKHDLENTSIIHRKNHGDTIKLGVTMRVWVWTCPKCHKICNASYGKTRKDYSRYVSRCCRASLVENGWQEIEEGQNYLIR